MKAKAYSIIAASLFLTVLSFQNCSPVSFAAAESVSASGGGGNTDVEDVVRSLEPTLAVRGLGCVECHAKIDSNVVTDYGFGSEYFFSENLGNNWWKSGSPYGDHAQSLKTTEFSSSAKIYVPNVTFSQTQQDATTSATLGDYVRSQLAQSIHTSSQATEVRDVKSVYIGAPTNAQIASIFQLTNTTRSRFFKSNKSSSGLNGLKDEGTFFRNEGTLVCDGDLGLQGPLYLENLHIKTAKGCRIYVMGSVFIYGPITYENNDETRNLQISSSSAIIMGLGLTQENGQYCLPGAEWYQNENVGESLRHRLTKMWTVPAQFTRATANPADFGNQVVAEAAAIEAKLGPLKDASCRPETRNVGFERILLNASHVHSRYIGDVQGTIIAEFALISLHQFKFKFDPVFRSVDVLPKLDRGTYLSVKEN